MRARGRTLDLGFGYQAKYGGANPHVLFICAFWLGSVPALSEVRMEVAKTMGANLKQNKWELDRLALLAQK